MINNQLFMGKSTQSTVRKENRCAKGRVLQNVTVVLPAYNEEVSIGSLVLLIRLYADNVFVVDDCSSDRTAEIAKNAGADVIVHTSNKGKGTALETGFKAAVDLGADIIVTMDSGGQHNPADIPRLVAPIIKGSADMVNGNPYLYSLSKNTSIYRRVGQTILDRFTNMDSGFMIRDSQSCFRAFAVSKTGILRFNVQGMSVESKTPAEEGKSGIRIKEVEIGAFHDFEGSVRDPIKYILGALKTIVKDIEVNKPLYLYAVPGFALATCGFYMGLKFLEAFLLGIEGLHSWSVFLMVFLAVAGICMTMRGIVIYSLAEVTTQTEI